MTANKELLIKALKKHYNELQQLQKNNPNISKYITKKHRVDIQNAKKAINEASTPTIFGSERVEIYELKFAPTSILLSTNKNTNIPVERIISRKIRREDLSISTVDHKYKLSITFTGTLDNSFVSITENLIFKNPEKDFPCDLKIILEWPEDQFNIDNIIDTTTAFQFPSKDGPVVINRDVVAYRVRKNQGPTQIAEDINDYQSRIDYDYQLSEDIKWEFIVKNNMKFFSHINNGVFNKENDEFKHLNLNPGDLISLKEQNEKIKIAGKIEELFDKIEEEQAKIDELENEVATITNSISRAEMFQMESERQIREDIRPYQRGDNKYKSGKKIMNLERVQRIERMNEELNSLESDIIKHQSNMSKIAFQINLEHDKKSAIDFFNIP